MYFIQHCFICRPLDFTVPTDAGIEPRTAVATGAYFLIQPLRYSAQAPGVGGEHRVPQRRHRQVRRGAHQVRGHERRRRPLHRQPLQEDAQPGGIQ